MRNTMNKKALSSVVAAVVTIGITITAIAIITPMIMNAIKGPMLSPEVTCSEIRNLMPLTIENACYNNEGEIRIKLARAFDSMDISSLAFSLENNGEIRRWLCSNDCRNCGILNAGETKFYYLQNIGGLNDAAIILSAGECAVSRTEIITQCSD